MSFINRQGKLIIPLMEPIEGVIVSEGLLVAPDHHRRNWGYRDATGKWVIPPRFTFALPFSEGLAAVQDGKVGKYGFIDKTGKMVIPPRYDCVDEFSGPGFSEGLVPVEVKEKWGYINKTGKMVIAANFDQAESFRDGLAFVHQGGIGGYIDHTGKFVWKSEIEISK
ncbi:MAG: WG repeat-containing protein [Proteobacteria bacterium]|nr:WG repeat-containing protein [Pseudomonadota bacterium]MBU4354667.1 WG repeat-containing protein [Pseudomonadota bacterium]